MLSLLSAMPSPTLFVWKTPIQTSKPQLTFVSYGKPFWSHKASPVLNALPQLLLHPSVLIRTLYHTASAYPHRPSAPCLRSVSMLLRAEQSLALQVLTVYALVSEGDTKMSS